MTLHEIHARMVSAIQRVERGKTVLERQCFASIAFGEMKDCAEDLDRIIHHDTTPADPPAPEDGWFRNV